MEAILRAVDTPCLEKAVYPAKLVSMKDGSKIVVRQAARAEAPEVLKAVRLYIDINKDFYDIVAWRTYAEILVWKMYRIKDHYLLLGIQDDIDLAGLDVKSKMLRKRSEGGKVEVIVEAPSSLMDAKSQRL